ncbi:MAG TPA: thioredoxin family protein [Candidatus Micrarchaeota archaeon]|nr:thioredoxin family protein [Candidatus Micrarchaeota archaeon]
MQTYIEIITSPNCPHSPRAAKMLQTLVGKMGDVHYIEISMLTEQGQQIAENYGVEATPAIIINGAMAFVGVPTKTEMAGMIKDAKRTMRDKTNYFF